MEDTTLRIEYKKFNTFLFDYIKTINQGWLFMKMKHKYAIGTQIKFQFNVSGINKKFDILGKVVYDGKNEEGKDGIGISLDADKNTKDSIINSIKENCEANFGTEWTEEIVKLIDTE